MPCISEVTCAVQGPRRVCICVYDRRTVLLFALFIAACIDAFDSIVCPLLLQTPFRSLSIFMG